MPSKGSWGSNDSRIKQGVPCIHQAFYIKRICKIISKLHLKYLKYLLSTLKLSAFRTGQAARCYNCHKMIYTSTAVACAHLPFGILATISIVPHRIPIITLDKLLSYLVICCRLNVTFVKAANSCFVVLKHCNLACIFKFSSRMPSII